MRIFDLPRSRSAKGRPWRFATLGSGRLNAVFDELAMQGRLVKVWADYATSPLTFGEGCQALRYWLHEIDLPEALLPVIFDDPKKLQPRTATTRRLIQSIDALVMEVSELNQLRCGQFHLSRPAVLRRFAGSRETFFASWYHPLTEGRNPSEMVIEGVLSELRSAAAADKELAETILRKTHVDRLAASEVVRHLAEASHLTPAQWTLVSPFTMRGVTGSMMEERHQLIEVLEQATWVSGSHMFNPTALAVGSQRPITASPFPDLNSYAPEQRAAIGEEILSTIERIAASGDAPRLTHPRSRLGPTAAVVASRISALLIDLHTQRVADLGEDGSGLYAHYNNLMKLGALIRSDIVRVVEVVTEHLPQFGECHVFRAGLGEIGFLLAALGEKTNAFESNTKRLAALDAGAARLVEKGLIQSNRLRSIAKTLPSSEDIATGSRPTLAIVTQLMLGSSSEERDQAFTEFARYDAILYAPDMLARGSADPDKEEAVLARFQELGFTFVREFPSASLTYCAKESARIDMATPTTAGNPADLIKLLDGSLSALSRLDGSAVPQSGGSFFKQRHADVAATLIRSLPRFARCDVLRARPAGLALLLAALGQNTAAIEANPDHAVTVANAAQKLVHDGLLEPSNLAIIDRPASHEAATALAIATEPAPHPSEQVGADAFSSLTAYNAILLEPARFLQTGAASIDLEAVKERLRLLGYSSIRDFREQGLIFAARAGYVATKSESRSIRSPTTERIEREDVRPLIFDRLSLHWKDVKLEQPFDFLWATGNKYKWALRSFPLPGRPVPQDLSAVQVRPDGLDFPHYGPYFVTGPFGAIKLLLVDPASNDDAKIIAICQFLACCVYHSGADTHLSYERANRYPIYPVTLLQKLFYSDQPLALWCGNIADVLAFVLHLSGYTSRKLALKNSNGVGHIFLEVYFPTERRWLMVDPDFGVMLRHEDRALAAADVVALRAAGKTSEIQLVPLSDNQFSSNEVNFPTSFTGQFTWKPEHFINRRLANLSYYHEVVIDRGYEGLIYYGYKFSHAVTTRVRPIIENGGPFTLSEIEAEMPLRP